MMATRGTLTANMKKPKQNCAASADDTESLIDCCNGGLCLWHIWECDSHPIKVRGGTRYKEGSDYETKARFMSSFDSFPGDERLYGEQVCRARRPMRVVRLPPARGQSASSRDPRHHTAPQLAKVFPPARKFVALFVSFPGPCRS